MLLKIRLENMFSINELELDLTKNRYTYKKDMILNELNVNPIAVYGVNGSGKSSFFKAMAFINSLFLEVDTYDLEVNQLFKSHSIKHQLNNGYLLSRASLLFKLEDDIYEYNLVYCNNEIQHEEVLKNNIKLVDRIGNKYLIPLYYDNYKETDLLNKSVLLVEKRQFSLLYDYLSNFSTILDNRVNTINKAIIRSNIYELFYKYQDSINEVIEDIPGIYPYKIVKENYNYYLDIDNNLLAINKMSKGIFNIYLIVLLLLISPKDSAIFIDDLDSNCHPFVLRRLLSLFNDKGIQVIFSAHNTYLMSLLRPDQIYFVSFDGMSSHYVRLTNIKDSIREINNIEKMYLSDIFRDIDNKD